MNGTTPIPIASNMVIFNVIIKPNTPQIYIANVPEAIPSVGFCDIDPIIWAAIKNPMI